MSLTAVYFDSEEIYAGQYHKHPYGEINCVVQIDPTFELEGLPVGENWRGAGELPVLLYGSGSWLSLIVNCQVGRALGREHIIIRGQEAVAAWLSFSCRQDGSRMMLDRRIRSHRRSKA